MKKVPWIFLFPLVFYSGIGFRSIGELPRAALPPEGIHTEGGFAPDQLVRDIFAKGACDNIYNVKALGPSDGLGFFENGESSIGINSGIILATGPISHAHPPNNADDKSGNFNASGEDPDLKLLATGPVHDAVGIEFDFVPLDSFVTFRYVFASEEYCEFAGSQYNDVFGFFISGPGINGTFSNKGENVALIPGTSSFVAINSVNHYVNSSYYVRNERKKDRDKCGLPALDVSYHDKIQYDGFTKIFTALLKLAPCQTYHLRMVVGDVGDADYDSAVFLEAESFNIGDVVSLNPGPSSTEGCNDGFFTFNRSSTSPLDLPVTVAYKIGSSSTATAGLDFAPLSGKITIPPGQPSVKLPVHAYNDGLTEGYESLVLQLDIPCSCYRDSAVLILKDPELLTVELPSGWACPGQQATLSPVVTGGVPPYHYVWSTGATGASVSVPADPSIQYGLTVTDACDQSAQAATTVSNAQPPRAVLSGESAICPGDTAYLRVDLAGSPPWQLEFAVDGQYSGSSPMLTASPYLLPAVSEGVYSLLTVSDAACQGTVSGTARVTVLGPRLEGVIQPVSCYGMADGAIQATLLQGNPPFEIAWTPDIGSGLSVQNLEAGLYTLAVRDADGCRVQKEFRLEDPAPIQGIGVDCAALETGGDFLVMPKGGAPPYQFAVSPDGPWHGAEILAQFEPGENYPLHIRDQQGCLLVQDFLMPVRYERMVDVPVKLSLRYGETLQMPAHLNIPETLISTVEWSPADGLSCTDCIAPVIAAPFANAYTLRIGNQFGCSETWTIRIDQSGELPIFVPNAFSPNGDQYNDFLRIYPIPGLVRSIRTYQVYDRWGGLLYSAKDLDPYSEYSGWDGYVNRRPADAGVYTFWMELELSDGKREILKGSVVLMR